jgi:hypothetical protein
MWFLSLWSFFSLRGLLEQRILGLLVKDMDAGTIDPEREDLSRLDGPRVLHARHDFGASEISEQQTFVAEHLGEIYFR